MHQAAIVENTTKEPQLIPLHLAIRRHHKKASEHYNALQIEVKKQSPDPSVIKEHASGLYHELKGAESEHKKMKSNRRVKELVEPDIN